MLKNRANLFFLLSMAVGLSGCVSTINVKDGVLLKPKEGFLVTDFHSSHSGYSVTIIKKTNLTVASAIFKIKPDDNFWILALPAGDYTWRGIYVGTSYSEFRNDMDFKISPGELNYIGDMVIDITSDIQSYRMSVVDNSEKVEQRIKKDYPTLYAKHKFTKNITIDKRQH